MSGRIGFRIFAHSWISDWNHSNAHFLRGLARELLRLGHEVRCYEELSSWSLTNLMREEGEAATQAIQQFHDEFPELDIRHYQRGETLHPTLCDELRDADIVILHEWTDAEVVNAVLGLKARFQFCALLHDTHHRAHTRAGELLFFPLQLFDGVLACSESIRRIYSDGFGQRAWTFHEAADTSHFAPREEARQTDLLWIGNLGEEERARRLTEFFIEPVAELQNCRTVVHGVGYSEQLLQALEEAGIEFRGYLPNLMAPPAYARSALALHVPRPSHSASSNGVPSIRVFEALACGATLICSDWKDEAKLFRAGEDYVVTRSGAEMKLKVQRLLRDDAARRQIGANGRQTVLERHTCAHRAQQLVSICEEIN